MGIAIAIIKALTAAWNVWTQERAIRNRPDMVKAKTADAIQEVTDRLNKAESVVADPNATTADHAEALRQIRLAHS